MYTTINVHSPLGGATCLVLADIASECIGGDRWVEDAYKKSMETSPRWGIMAPKNDPLPLAPPLGQATSHLGIIARIPTTQYTTFLAARLMTPLDHLTDGRAGINVVASVSHRAAQTYGFGRHIEHDLLYEMAGGWMEAVTQLCDSWGPQAVVYDLVTPRYVDHTKVHTIDREGNSFEVPGSPEYRSRTAATPGDRAGRRSSRHVPGHDVSVSPSVAAMKDLPEEMHRRLEAHGRKPGDCRILSLCTPMIGETDKDAHERRRALEAFRETSEMHLDRALYGLSYRMGGIDLSEFDLDKTLPDDLAGNGEQSVITYFLAKHKGNTLREAIKEGGTSDRLGFSGGSDPVVGQMAEAMERVGGDGFLLSPAMTRRSIAEITEGLVSAPQRRALTRTEYSHDLFRNNLLEWVITPERRADIARSPSIRGWKSSESAWKMMCRRILKTPARTSGATRVGTKGKRHVNHRLGKILVVLDGTLTIDLGKPPERYDVPPGGVVVVELATALQLRNADSDERALFIYSAPPETGRDELIPDPPVRSYQPTRTVG